MEDMHLKSQSGEKVWPVLLTENGNASAIIENVWSRGMLLLPWANRIAYVSLVRHHAGAVSHVTVPVQRGLPGSDILRKVDASSVRNVRVSLGWFVWRWKASSLLLHGCIFYFPADFLLVYACQSVAFIRRDAARLPDISPNSFAGCMFCFPGAFLRGMS